MRCSRSLHQWRMYFRCRCANRSCLRLNLAGSLIPMLQAVRGQLRLMLIATMLTPTSVLATEASVLNRQFLDRAAAGDLDTWASGPTAELRAALPAAIAREQSDGDPDCAE